MKKTTNFTTCARALAFGGALFSLGVAGSATVDVAPAKAEGFGQVNITGDCKCKRTCRSNVTPVGFPSGLTVKACLGFCETRFLGCKLGEVRTEGRRPGQ